MTTTRTAAAEKLSGVVGTPREKPADVSKDKEKAEKRRALGRGLESLLPGPRMVAGGAATAVDTRSTGGVSVETPVHVSGAAESASAAAVEVRGDSQAGAAGHPETAVHNETVWRTAVPPPHEP